MLIHAFRRALALVLALLAAVSSGADDGGIRVEPNGRFSLSNEKLTYVADATAVGVQAGPSTPPAPRDDPRLGPGARLPLSVTEGSNLELFRVNDLTILRGVYRPPGPEPVVIRSLDVAHLPIDLGVPVGELKILGTGGLADAAQAPGSYMWLAVVDPKTRAGVVVGWLSSHRGNGVILPTVVDGRLSLRCRLDYGSKRLAPALAPAPAAGAGARAGIELEPLAVGYFSDARLGLESYADTVARYQDIQLPAQPSGYCTWYHAGSSNAKRIAELADFAARELKPFGLSFIQIDDGWQAGESKNGPRKNFTSHREGGPYPDGMLPSARGIADLGLTPGLWLMPFSGTFNDRFFADRQHWFARRGDGQPFDTTWGGSCFDLTRPEVQDYVRQNIRRAVQEWGYQYLKLDGLWTGAAADLQYINDAYKDDQLGNATLADPATSHIEALNRGLQIVREAAGPGVFLLGCCAPQNMRSFGCAFGRVDAMRVGPDNGATVDALAIGPDYGSRNYFLHGRVWWNDPDPIYVRTSLSQAQAELSATWAAVSGQMTVASDDLERLSPPRLNILKRVLPAHGRPARPVDLFERQPPRCWVIPAQPRNPDHTLVGLFNWEKEPVTIDESLERLGLDPALEYAAYEFWSDRLLPPVAGRLAYSFASIGGSQTVSEEKSTGQVHHCCAAVALRPLLPHPQVLSTSRHVTQGLVDLSEETWNGQTNELSARCRVVGNDPCELRLLTRSPGASWKLVALETKANDVVIEPTSREQDPLGELVRVTIRSSASQVVPWSARFEPAAR